MFGFQEELKIILTNVLNFPVNARSAYLVKSQKESGWPVDFYYIEISKVLEEITNNLPFEHERIIKSALIEAYKRYWEKEIHNCGISLFKRLYLVEKEMEFINQEFSLLNRTYEDRIKNGRDLPIKFSPGDFWYHYYYITSAGIRIFDWSSLKDGISELELSGTTLNKASLAKVLIKKIIDCAIENVSIYNETIFTGINRNYLIHQNGKSVNVLEGMGSAFTYRFIRFELDNMEFKENPYQEKGLFDIYDLHLMASYSRHVALLLFKHLNGTELNLDLSGIDEKRLTHFQNAWVYKYKNLAQEVGFISPAQWKEKNHGKDKAYQAYYSTVEGSPSYKQPGADDIDIIIAALNDFPAAKALALKRKVELNK